jgi:hypothetical protein
MRGIEEILRDRALMKTGFISTVPAPQQSPNLAQPGSWEFGRFISEHAAVRYAREHGWGRETQIRRVIEHGQTFWLVEPFEEDCGCPDILAPFGEEG